MLLQVAGKKRVDAEFQHSVARSAHLYVVSERSICDRQETCQKVTRMAVVDTQGAQNPFREAADLPVETAELVTCPYRAIELPAL